MSCTDREGGGASHSLGYAAPDQSVGAGPLDGSKVEVSGPDSNSAHNVIMRLLTLSRRIEEDIVLKHEEH